MPNDDWRSLFDDPNGIFALYDDAPDLSGSALSYVHIDDRDASVTLGFELWGLPPRKATEWPDREANAVDMYLAFFHVTNVRIRGWSGSRKQLISFDGSIDEIHVHIAGEDEDIRFNARSARVLSARPYLASSSI